VCRLNFKDTLNLIFSEVKSVLSRVDEEKTEKFIETIQLLGSLFEQSLLFYLEGAVLCLMRRMNISEEEMRKRHTNLE